MMVKIIGAREIFEEGYKYYMIEGIPEKIEVQIQHNKKTRKLIFELDEIKDDEVYYRMIKPIRMKMETMENICKKLDEMGIEWEGFTREYGEYVVLFRIVAVIEDGKIWF